MFFFILGKTERMNAYSSTMGVKGGKSKSNVLICSYRGCFLCGWVSGECLTTTYDTNIDLAIPNHWLGYDPP